MVYSVPAKKCLNNEFLICYVRRGLNLILQLNMQFYHFILESFKFKCPPLTYPILKCKISSNFNIPQKKSFPDINPEKIPSKKIQAQGLVVSKLISTYLRLKVT